MEEVQKPERNNLAFLEEFANLAHSVEELWIDAGSMTEDIKGDVKYNHTEVEKYRVLVSDKITWKMQIESRGENVDSVKLLQRYRKKWKDPNRQKPKRQTGLMNLVKADDSDTNHWVKNGIIWVLTLDNKFYSHVPKIGRFHHSSFVAGGDIRSAGMWIVEDGRLLAIAPLSGHYQPTLEQFMCGVWALEPAITSNTCLFLCVRATGGFQLLHFNEWSNMPWGEFRHKYQSHPFESFGLKNRAPTPMDKMTVGSMASTGAGQNMSSGNRSQYLYVHNRAEYSATPYQDAVAYFNQGNSEEEGQGFVPTYLETLSARQRYYRNKYLEPIESESIDNDNNSSQ